MKKLFMKKLLMIVACATLLSSNRAWSDGAQVLSWTGRGLSMAITGIPGVIALRGTCFMVPQDPGTKTLQQLMGVCSAIFLLETAYKSSWYFSKPHCDTCAANKNNSQKQSVK
jgi:hypothetical protein